MLAVGLFNQVHDGNGVGISEPSSTSASSASSGAALTLDNLPESRRLRRRRFRIEAGEIELAQIGRDVLEAAIGVEAPQLVPVIRREVFLVAVRPGDVVAAIVSRQIDAVGLVVGRDDEAEAIENVVFLQVLLVDPQHVGRRRGVDLGVVVEFEAVDVAEIAPFIDPQNDRFDEAVELARTDASGETS